jgi:hypothetical protein
VFESPLSEHPPKKSISEVKINGKWKSYGLMSQNLNAPYQRGDYLGTSNEIRIDGFAQKALEVEYHFWSKSE